jgi:hypothetical protein
MNMNKRSNVDYSKKFLKDSKEFSRIQVMHETNLMTFEITIMRRTDLN